MTALSPPGECPLHIIGNTPVIRLRHVVPDGCASIYLKLESVNPTGSYKDRIAKTLIEEAERRGDLKKGMTVVEASGGSTGSSLAFVCAVKGYKCRIVSSNAFAAEKLRTMEAFGATLDVVHSPSGQVTKDLIPTMIDRARFIDEMGTHYCTNQFRNEDAFVGYTEMGKELVRQFSGGIDAFCGMAGSAGMITGVERVLKQQWPRTRVIVCEPATSPMLTEGWAGTHGVDGVGMGAVPPLLDRQVCDEARAISEEQGRIMCRRLALEEGLLVGTSTGLNVIAAIELAKEIGLGGTVVTVACDTGLKYLSGDLFSNVP